MTVKRPITDHPAIKQIERSVTNLSMPVLAPLLGVLMDIQTQTRAERSEIRAKMEATKIEAYGAAARLMAAGRPPALKNPTYFDLVEEQKRITL